ncbi:hypothetical protein LCGC14_1628120 [marine sediment metagenome]|uniref:LamG-like jellyroll fold domain-containing protein n=1 Tax=marine sediment metagenome TaxID=412755 RepID=A0A0F9IQI8_9ZZZZ
MSGWIYQQKPSMGWPLQPDSKIIPDVGFWPMLAGTGDTVQDLSRNGFNGIKNAGVAWVGASTGSALDFEADSMGQVLTTFDNDSGSKFTFIFKYTPESTVAQAMGWRSANRFYWFYNGSGLHQFFFNASIAINFSHTLTAGVTYTIAITYNRGQGCLYVDGVLVDDVVSGTQTWFIDGAFAIGNRNGSNLPMDGIIEYVYLYRRALSASEIALLYRYPFYMFKDPNEVAVLGAGVVAAGTNPKGPLGHPLHGALAGPISF